MLILFGIHVNRSGLEKFSARIGGSTGAGFTEGKLRLNTHEVISVMRVRFD